MNTLIEKYTNLKTIRDQYDQEARDYIKENSVDAKMRADKISKSHVKLLKFLRSLSTEELECLAQYRSISISLNQNQIISKLMAIFEHRTKDN